MKIVLAKNIEYGWELPFEADVTLSDDYVQISEVVDVDFPPIEYDTNSRKIEVIDNDIAKAKAGIELLERAKAELLAIPYMEAE